MQTIVGAGRAAARAGASPGATAQRSRTGAVARVLVVEDEAEIAALVAYQLTRDGYRVETARNGNSALDALNRNVPDLVVLDRMLPGLSGDDVLKAIRADAAMRTLPVVLLTAKREQEERISGLEMGADDYVTKPFSPRELALRVDAVLRRARGEIQSPSGGGRVLQAGSLRMDLGAMRVTLQGGNVSLTPTEFRLLRSLMERSGRALSRHHLLVEAWAMESGVVSRPHTRTVDMHVRRLRRKLGPAGRWVETVRGFGYRFQPPKQD